MALDATIGVSLRGPSPVTGLRRVVGGATPLTGGARSLNADGRGVYALLSGGQPGDYFMEYLRIVQTTSSVATGLKLLDILESVPSSTTIPAPTPSADGASYPWLQDLGSLGAAALSLREFSGWLRLRTGNLGLLVDVAPAAGRLVVIEYRLVGPVGVSSQDTAVPGPTS